MKLVRRRPTVVLMVVLVVCCVTVASYLTFFTGSASQTAMATGNMAMTGATMSASSCQLVSAGQLDELVGHLVAAPAATSTARSTTCTYSMPGSTQPLTITYSMDVSSQTFERWPGVFAAANNQAHHLAGVGDAAYYGTSSSAGVTWLRFVVLSGTNEVEIQAPSSLSKTEHLISQLLPSL